MANCQVEIQTISFDVSDPQITQVKVTVKWKWSGDFPVAAVKSVYMKSFPARISVQDLFKDEVPNYLEW